MEQLVLAALAEISAQLQNEDPAVRLAAAVQILNLVDFEIGGEEAEPAPIDGADLEELAAAAGVTEEQVSGSTDPKEVERRLAAAQAQEGQGGHVSQANGGLGRPKR